jgi:transposase
MTTALGGGAPTTMILTYKYRLNPTKRQHRDLKAYLEQQRLLYNAALEERIEAYRKVNNAKVELVWGPYARKDGAAAEGYVRRRLSDGAAGNRRRHILAAVLSEPLTLARKLDMLERLEPVQSGIAEDFQAFYAGRADTPSALAHDLLFAAPDAKRARTRARMQQELARRWEASKANVGVGDQSRALTQIRADDPAYSDRQRRIQRQTLNKLDLTYKAFFRGGGFPKFKGYHRYTSFAFDAFAQIKLQGNRLRFAGLSGGLRFMQDRPLPQIVDPETGEFVTSIKGVSFKAEDRCSEHVSRWYVGFQVEVQRAPARTKGKTVGVDWGTSVLAALSTGEMIGNPRFGEQSAKALTRVQRRVARGVKGSKRRAKALRHKRTIERKTANRRRNHLDKVTKRLTTHYRVIAVEDFPIKGLMNAERVGETLPTSVKTRRNREVLDTAPYLLRQMTGYKATLHGAELRTVDPTDLVPTRLPSGKTAMLAAQPTQRCCMCGLFHFKDNLTEDHVCTTPGVFLNMRLPRKVNAARVIEQLAFGDEAISPLAGVDRGGPVPGGAAQAANGGNGLRRLEKTADGQPTAGRRSHRELPSRMSGQPPKPPPGRLRTEPS